MLFRIHSDTGFCHSFSFLERILMKIQLSTTHLGDPNFGSPPVSAKACGLCVALHRLQSFLRDCRGWFLLKICKFCHLFLQLSFKSRTWPSLFGLCSTLRGHKRKSRLWIVVCSFGSERRTDLFGATTASHSLIMCCATGLNLAAFNFKGTARSRVFDHFSASGTNK